MHAAPFFVKQNCFSNLASDRYRTSKSSAFEAGVRPAARRVELNYAAAAALASESHEEQRPVVATDALENVRRDAVRLEADEAAAAREWTRRLIESGCGTSRDDDDDSDLHSRHCQWGGDAEIIDEKVRFRIVSIVHSIMFVGRYCATQRAR
jgi:hypothetical protein